MQVQIEVEQEDDGRYLASARALPGVLAYGQTRQEAMRRAWALALRVIADRIECEDIIQEMAPTKVLALENDQVPQCWDDLLAAVSGGATDVVITQQAQPVMAFIPFADYLAVADELDDVRAARRADAVYQEYLRDPSIVRPWAEVKAEMIAEGLL